MQGLYVQYGCFFTAPHEWVNFDSAFALKWEKLPLVSRVLTWNTGRFPQNVRVGDIVDGLPIAEGSCRGVYASHVLEHLALQDFHIALSNTRKLLAKDGIFRVIVPDLEWSAREYIRRLETGDSAANAFFLDATSLGHRTRERDLFPFFYNFLKNSAHLWMWDAQSLSQCLHEHGFMSVRRCCYGDCEDPMFRMVESEERFENAVALEARP